MISQSYKQVTELLFSLEKLGIKYEITAVEFEFQKDSKEM